MIYATDLDRTVIFSNKFLDECNEDVVCVEEFNDKPISYMTFKALKELKQILNKNEYDILHCHTPMGAVIGRLAAKKLWKRGKIKVIYTAHGFHFYKGAPLLNWFLY